MVDAQSNKEAIPVQATTDLAERLRKFELLKQLSDEELALVGQHASIRELERDITLIEKGQPNTVMYMILEGELSIHLDTIDGEIVALLRAGQSVGELSLLDKAPASAFVRTAVASTVLAVDESTLWQLIESSHRFAVNMLIQLTQRLRANNEVVSDSNRQRKVFERAAMFDGLTGVHNRRWFDQALERMVARFDRSREPLCVAVTDVDHFKKFNDTYGHRAGDEVLVAVAKTLSEGLRPTDLLARYGGEEFVAIFPQTDLAGAEVAAERLRSRVAAAKVFDPDGKPLPPVTISIGVAELTHGMDHGQLFSLADTALYEAKHSGRNRVVLSGHTPAELKAS